MSITHENKTYRIPEPRLKFRWDEAKDLILKCHYEQGDSRPTIARLLNCAVSTVHRRLFVLNIPNKPTDKPFWDSQKDGIIAAGYLDMTNKQLAKVLGRQAYHVADRLAYLSLSRQVGRKKDTATSP